jgi:hypothetical protein
MNFVVFLLSVVATYYLQSTKITHTAYWAISTTFSCLKASFDRCFFFLNYEVIRRQVPTSCDRTKQRTVHTSVCGRHLCRKPLVFLSAHTPVLDRDTNIYTHTYSCSNSDVPATLNNIPCILKGNTALWSV